MECTLTAQSVVQGAEDQQLYINAILSDINSRPVDEQESYCSGVWEDLLPYADTYASF